MSSSVECMELQELKVHVRTHIFCVCTLRHPQSTSQIYSGRHPCLWCTISSELMKVPREQRAVCAPRTLDALQADLLRFKTAGKGNIKVAKNYNNVISHYFFPIPINQVNMQYI